MRYFRSYIFFTVTTALSAACAVGPDFHAPPSPSPSRYTESLMSSQTVGSKGPGGKVQRFKPGANIPAEWWILFHSPELNALILRGVANSPNIAAAQAALRQAQAMWRAEVGALFPTITASFLAERQQFTATTFGDDTNPTIFSLYNASINGSYTLDVFGGIRRQIEALGAQVDYQRFELEATYLTLTANIVTTAVTEASIRGQIQATHELIKSQEKTLTIINQQFELGGVSSASILSQQTQLAQTRATLPPLEKSLAQNRHALAVLVGALPSQSDLPHFHLNDLHLPTSLPVSLPSSLVQQRPDVQAATALLHVASAQIGVATANLLPQFTLSGSYASQPNFLKDLFDPSTIIWNYMGQVVQTVFDAGTLSADRRAAIAAYEQAAAQYQQTVLQAFQNVADALRALEYDAKALKAQTQAETAARNNLRLTRQQFKLGAVSYLSLLSAELQYQQTRISRIQAEALRYNDTAALFQALGGGWWNRAPLPTGEKPENAVVQVLEQIL